MNFYIFYPYKKNFQQKKFFYIKMLYLKVLIKNFYYLQSFLILKNLSKLAIIIISLH